MGVGNRQLDDCGDVGGPSVEASELAAAALERRVTLNAIASEVSHELAHTLNFLRVLIEELSDDGAASAEDVALARREVERLARLMGHLRQLKLPVAPWGPVPLRDVILRAVAAAHSALGSAQVNLSASIEPALSLSADPSLLAILLRDVLADVVQRSPQSRSVDVRLAVATDSRDPREGLLDVMGGARCDKPAMDCDRFSPWGPGMGPGRGAGLAVAGRLARLFGWTLEEIREGERDGLRLRIPATAFQAEYRECAS